MMMEETILTRFGSNVSAFAGVSLQPHGRSAFQALGSSVRALVCNLLALQIACALS